VANIGIGISDWVPGLVALIEPSKRICAGFCLVMDSRKDTGSRESKKARILKIWVDVLISSSLVASLRAHTSRWSPRRRNGYMLHSASWIRCRTNCCIGPRKVPRLLKRILELSCLTLVYLERSLLSNVSIWEYTYSLVILTEVDGRIYSELLRHTFCLCKSAPCTMSA